jgi:Xaa-Pro aminopeptidase
MSDFLIERRARVAAALQLDGAVLLVGAGEPQPLPEGSDQTYPFRSHAEYFYLTGRECAGGVVAFDPRDGAERGWVSFVPEVTEAARIWEGRTPLPGTPLTGFAPWLAAREGRPIAALGAPVQGVAADASRTQSAREALTHARRPKDARETGHRRVPLPPERMRGISM